MCAKKNNRLWWAIGLLFVAGTSAAGWGASFALNDHDMLREHEKRIEGSEKRMDGVDAHLIRIEDKLDRLIIMQNK